MGGCACVCVYLQLKRFLEFTMNEIAEVKM